MNRVTSDHFRVGQKVFVPNPRYFTSELARYLEGRDGTVTEVAPVIRPNPQHCGNINKVLVKWHKKRGRGKELTKWMPPDSILAVFGGVE